MMKSFLIFPFALLTLVFSCKKEESIPNSSESPAITSSAELNPFLNTFIAEGRKRGHNIPDDLNGITYEIKEIEEDGVAGVCYWISANPNHIVLNSIYWNQFSSDQKESVLFHELGHCFLNRDHNDAALSNGTCESIMHSGTSQNCQHAYNANSKSYYLDELFGFIN